MPYSDFAYTPQNNDHDHGTDAQLLQAAHHLVDVYLVYLREHETAGDLFDTRELPASKGSLINAFRVVIATESRPGVRALLVKAGMTLAQFQENIGPRMSVRPAHQKEKPSDGHWRPEPSQIRRFDSALMRLGEDRTRLVQMFRHAADIAEHKPYYNA
ncbi:hypothetical protein [Aliirhizobium smilacinae]|uniref:Uncharacterized protein n=1 Tax=Aliirhizobium smilacinae TaxID=1395944 RepID=A0A5C4XRS9_9HYPH|nr:hypothetical protein [Rhizobium smilacinae]TNM66028.1 hypothetical protein FHP24_07360 [Rhizobium smilacinae]